MVNINFYKNTRCWNFSLVNNGPIAWNNRNIRAVSCWIQLCDENTHEWKIIPSHLIKKYFGKSFKFHSCLSFDRKLLIKFPKFHKNILFHWISSLSAFSELPSCIMSNFLWFNKHILIEKKSIFLRYFSGKGLNFVYQLFDNNGSVKSWSSKEEFDFSNISNFKWQQLIYAIPPFRKKIIKERDNADNLLLPNHYLIKKTHYMVLRN